MAHAHLVKAARKDYPDVGIKKGESYWWWKFNFSRTVHRSKTQPKRSQLTQSAFLSHIYDIEERIQGMGTDTDIEGEIEDIKSDLENLRDEQEEKRSNMPEQLQETGSGEILQNRYDSLDEMIGELDGIDADVDEEAVGQEATDEFLREKGKAIEELTDEDKKALEEAKIEKIAERKQAVLDELGNISYNGE